MRPTFILSLDTELIWGSFDHTSPSRFARRYPDVRGALESLLRLLESYELAATWAVVGHLFLGSCERDERGRAHADIPRARFDWYPKDWFSEDPGTDRRRDPLWYGDDIVDLLSASRVPQEIGSHSFSHVLFGDPGCPKAVAEAEVAKCVELARARGLTLRSFVFPRNSEGHHAVLRAHGFTAFRGRDENWFASLPTPADRAAHLIDQAVGARPPVTVPRQALPGLWNIPGSMAFLERRGARRLVPLAARVAKGKAGLARAMREGKVFHLWFHPFNLATDPEALLAALGAILAEAARQRDRGMLDVRTIGELATMLAASSP